ncbi:MAG: AAA domain-containing protein, partial [Pseudonocardiaceae bacterium]
PAVTRTRWLDEPAPTKGTHLQHNQIGRLKRAIAYLHDTHGVGYADMIAISPFRSVADVLERLTATHPGLIAGTIHTAQGREADVVFLVLGGAPDRPGAKAWAASSVNLVNVAASRAKRRLYVIGDREAWSKHNYFRQLAATIR